ncbi:hypothetical protein PMI01_00521 [Caulobacter sp. AP07]|uniref:DUF1349 domain-containing protein n=1 Tax=Caulobacter sp. AP07 TaxID=1144304 RepID=UPI000271DE56|nr:DUF1349 domain-containing protein [Caulobacter sp. AP07]EJL37767.1 hypothetical protein PMI01_00521 [Caulobacter sp. AP07]
MRQNFPFIALLSTLAISGVGSACAQEAAPKLAGLPEPLKWQNSAVEWKVGDDGRALTLKAGQKTDWFSWPGGGYDPDKSPRLLFKPADDFSFSAKVAVNAQSKYDAGCIVLYGTSAAWAKFCLEAQDDGQLSVISVVTRVLSDDVTSFSVKGDSVYLKLAKSGGVIFFYSSVDGKKWTIVRKLNLEARGGLWAGFSAQSPEGQGATAIFTDFHYGAGQIDVWKLQ